MLSIASADGHCGGQHFDNATDGATAGALLTASKVRRYSSIRTAFGLM
jgi:hypothetical protein